MIVFALIFEALRFSVNTPESSYAAPAVDTSPAVFIPAAKEETNVNKHVAELMALAANQDATHSFRR